MLASIALGVLALLGSAAAESSFWIVSHAPLASTRIDPIIAPGGVSAHVHQFIGGSGMKPLYEYNQLRKSKCTTANLANDLSNYWVPQLYRKGADGKLSLVPLGFANTYYLMRRQGTEPVYEFPAGFRMTGGNPMRSTFDKNDPAQAAVSYVCLDYQAGSPETNEFPTKRCKDGLRAQVFFPSCWDGKNNWLEGNKHVAYGEGKHDSGGKCPATHPKRIMSLFYEFIYKDDYDYVPGARVWAVGDTTGYSFHGDFANGWAEGLFTEIFKQGQTCNVGFNLRGCPVLAPFVVNNGSSCAPENLVVDEDIGISTPIARLPGNNPLYGREGPARPTNYVENKVFKSVKPALPSNWQKLGCIAQPSSGQALTGKVQSTDDMTPVKCMTFCAQNGFSLAGIEWSRECKCGNAFVNGASSTPVPEERCGMSCSGMPLTQGSCGGSRTLTVYKYTGTGAPSVGAVQGGNVQPQPVRLPQVKAEVIRKSTVRGDPTFPQGNEIIRLGGTRRSRVQEQVNEQE